MKKIYRILLISLLCLGTTVSVQAEDSVTDETNLFDGTDIVTEENAVPIDKDKIEGMQNVEMGDGLPSSDLKRSRSIYGTYWDTSGGTKKFYDANGTLMYNANSKMVIDVSEWQKTIDWDQVKAAGVDGAILRISYGFGNGYDKQFLRNVSECNRLGIPYGVYIYSYAYDANFAYSEAADVVNLLSQANVNLSFPIYYDIEKFESFEYAGELREHPTSPAEYQPIIATFINYMDSHGYKDKTHVYSYRSYLQNELNSSAILAKTSWVAAYTSTLGFTNPYWNGVQGWQYSSSESVAGIAGRVDVSCFSDIMFKVSVSATVPESISTKLTEQNLKFDSGYITGVKFGADITTISNNFSSMGSVKIYGPNGNTITNGVLATGQVIEVSLKGRSANDTYKIGVVVRGDVNGDGKISSMDYVKVKNHILRTNSLAEASLKGADVSADGKVSSLDYVKIKNQILGISSIIQ